MARTGFKAFRKRAAGFVLGARNSMLPQDPDYRSFLADLKERIRTAQLRAGLSVNRELVCLYWEIGREILDRQARLGWGAKVIDWVSRDLARSFPGMKGFSARNLKYMRKFADEYPEAEFVQQLAARIPWFHNCVLLDKLADRLFPAGLAALATSISNPEKARHGAESGQGRRGGLQGFGGAWQGRPLPDCAYHFKGGFRLVWKTRRISTASSRTR